MTRSAIFSISFIVIALSVSPAMGKGGKSPLPGTSAWTHATQATCSDEIFACVGRLDDPDCSHARQYRDNLLRSIDRYRKWRITQEKEKSDFKKRWYSMQMMSRSTSYSCEDGADKALQKKDYRILDSEYSKLFDLKGACLRKSCFSGLDLRLVDLSGANLLNADLSNIELGCEPEACKSLKLPTNRKDMQYTVLQRANLENADLHNVDLQYADLSRACTQGTFIGGTDLTNSWFEPVGLPRTAGIQRIIGLYDIQWHGDQNYVRKIARDWYDADYVGVARQLKHALKINGLRPWWTAENLADRYLLGNTAIPTGPVDTLLNFDFGSSGMVI